MNPTKFLITALAYLISCFAFGYLWHLVIFTSYYDKFGIFASPQEANLPLLLLGTLFESIAFAFLFLKFKQEQNPFVFGAKLGVAFYLFASSYGIFQIAAVTNIQGLGATAFILLEFLYMLIAGVICGLTVGFFNRK